MRITSRYLALPVNPRTRTKILLFTAPDGRLAFDLAVPLDFLHPQWTAYVDVSRFSGMELSLSTDPPMEPEGGLEARLLQAEEKPAPYDDPARPAVHFTASFGWINDPNGLIYANGVYHMFYQHNPVSPVWGNLHWGHAVSPDLVHWTEQDIALFPDEMGTMFSGSAILDRDNVSGLSPNGDAILLFYTAAGGTSRLSMGRPFTQCLAYSTDGGKTFRKYEKNPVIPHIVGENRDPKVVYCDELRCYLLALYLVGRDYAIFESETLLDWKEMQRVTLPEDDECPDFYPLPVDFPGGERKWVFSGASDTYVVGRIDRKTRRFVAEEKAKAYHIGRRVSYAAQTFSGLEPRRVKIAWDSMITHHTPFCGQMGIPCEVSLARRDGYTYMRTLPVAEFNLLVKNTIEYRAGDRYPDGLILSQTAAYDVTVRAKKTAPSFQISLFGLTLSVEPMANTLVYTGQSVPLSRSGGDLSIRVITDTVGVELFLDEGLIYTTAETLLDKNLNRLTVNLPDALVMVKELLPTRGDSWEASP